MRRVSWAVVLAAGGSTRMGSPKALLPLGGEPLVARHCAALESAARRVAVVVGAHAAEVWAAVPPWAVVVENPRWRTTWPGDSLRLALDELRIRSRCLVTPVDVPPARTETLAALLAARGPAVPLDTEGRPGHPVILDSAIVDHVRRRGAPDGLQALLAGATTVPTTDPHLAIDFDDRASYDHWLGGTGWEETSR